MSGMEKFLNVLGFQVEYDEDDPETTEQVVPVEEKRSRIPKKAEPSIMEAPKLGSPSTAQVVLLEPEKINDAQKICNELKSGKTVVINTERLSKEDMTRVLDFASGATYALDGSMREISDRVHVLAPYNVDIQTEELQTSYMDDDYEEEDEFDF